jgi:hypothetical protein
MAVEKEKYENPRHRSSPDVLIPGDNVQPERIGAFDPSLHASVRLAGLLR